MEGDEQGPGGDRRPPPIQLTIWAVIALAVVAIAGLFTVRLEHQPETTRDYPPRPLIADGEVTLLPAPDVDDEYLPCDDCHSGPDRPTGPARRELEYEHEDTELAHGNLWCLHCHDAENPNRLRLADASTVSFEDSWQLCTQCHGKKLPEWRAGVHGKVTGHWRGDREYVTCVACHDPHSPPTKPLTAEPKPKRPDEVVLRTRTPGDE
jgi:hypothetical protein